MSKRVLSEKEEESLTTRLDDVMHKILLSLEGEGFTSKEAKERIRESVNLLPKRETISDSLWNFC